MKKYLIILSVLIAINFLSYCNKANSEENKTKQDKKTEQTENKETKKNEESKETASNDEKKDSTENKEEEEKEDESIPVQIVSPYRGDIESYLLSSSNIDAEQVVDIYPLTSGIIRKIYFDEGDEVKKGAILAKLDDRETLLQEKKANISYKKLKSEYERQKQMFEKKLISKENFEEFKFNLEQIKLDWDQAKLMLSYTRIKAPFAGVVANRYIKEGNKINTNQLTFKVIQNKDKIAVIHIPQEERNSIYLKQKGFISSGDIKIPAYVKRLSPAIDPKTGTFKVTMGLKDTKNNFAVGQYVNIQIVKDVHKNTILLTKDALIYDSDKIYVFVVNEENKAMRKEIETGFESGNTIEVISGLTTDEKVVTAGKNSLKNNSLVKIIETMAINLSAIY